MNTALGSPATLTVHGREFEMFSTRSGRRRLRQPSVFAQDSAREPVPARRRGVNVTRADIEALANWDPAAEPSTEIVFTPARVLLQDFTGVPAVVDLAAMRDAVRSLGGKPSRVNPLAPAELVIDHSLQVDRHGRVDAPDLNARIEFERNRERYQFLRWGQNAFSNFQVVPPDTGIVHQINLEYLARVIFDQAPDGAARAYPDTVVGADSHTTMINGLGVLGWGVGGIEAEAGNAGPANPAADSRVWSASGLKAGSPRVPLRPTSSSPWCRCCGRTGVVGKFVEFFGDGLDELPVADRATIANMAPEYGATCGIFPIGCRNAPLPRAERTGTSADRTGRSLRASPEHVPRARIGPPPATARSLGSTWAPCARASLAQGGPQDRIALDTAKSTIAEGDRRCARGWRRRAGRRLARLRPVRARGRSGRESPRSRPAPNTSNPAVMLGAGSSRQACPRAGSRGQAVGQDQPRSGLPRGEELPRKGGCPRRSGGARIPRRCYGCTTCIGNSGPLPAAVSEGVAAGDVIACSVLSGNRNYEGRVHPEVRMNFLASPPLVVAYALAGTTLIDFETDPLGTDPDGGPCISETSGQARRTSRKPSRPLSVGHVPRPLRGRVSRR